MHIDYRLLDYYKVDPDLGVPPIRDDPLARNRRFYFFGDFSFLLVGMFHMAGYCGIGLRVCHIFLKFFVKTGKIGQKSYRLIKKLCFTRGMMVKIRGENCVSYKWVYPLVRNRRCQLTWPPKHVSYWWNPPVAGPLELSLFFSLFPLFRFLAKLLDKFAHTDRHSRGIICTYR